MSSHAAYTAGDRIPVDDRDDSSRTPFDGENAEDYEIADVSAPTDRDADKIQAENGFRDIPPGRHVLEVAGFRDKPEKNLYNVWLDGRLTSFESCRVKVRLCLPEDPRATVEDNFLLPPDDPKELAAYYNGRPSEKDKPGFQANKFIHFIDRLGFPFPAGGKLPKEARLLANWKKRRIIAEVTPARPFTGNDGRERPGFPQIKLFSYELAPPVGRSAGTGQTAGQLPTGRGPAAHGVGGQSGGGSTGSRPAQRSAASTAQPRTVQGLDNI